jgi:UDP-N-acetylmuramoylalanine-D-glutamate ligase
MNFREFESMFNQEKPCKKIPLCFIKDHLDLNAQLQAYKKKKIEIIERKKQIDKDKENAHMEFWGKFELSLVDTTIA